MNITLSYKMEAFDQQESQADLFEVFIHCCEVSNLFIFTVPSLPFLRLNGFAYFSFVDFPSERRMCILPFSEALLHRLDGYKSPLFCSSIGMVLVVSVFELSQ